MSSPSSREHHFESRLTWTGASKGPTRSYDAYDRTYRIEIMGKPPLVGSSAPVFRGDSALYNPEDWLVAALSACHCLSYLALAARAGLLVVAYEDRATGIMGRVGDKIAFQNVTLHPHVRVVAGSDLDRARTLHARAHAECFIASSVNFPVEHEPEISIDEA